MKFTSSKKDLLRALDRAAAIADKKSAMPILANALMSVQNGILTICASDLYLFVQSTIVITKSEDGAVCMSARDLLERVRSIPADDVTLTEKDESVAIAGPKGVARKFTQSRLPGDQFPKMPFTDPSESSMHIKASDVASILAQTIHAVSLETDRLALNSVRLAADGDSILSVTTDGRRLSKAESFAGKGKLEPLLLSLKGAVQLKKECDALGEEEITISRNGVTVLFTASDYSFAAQTVDATFPPFEQAVPVGLPNKAEVSRTGLIDSIKAVSMASDEKYGLVAIEFAKDALAISANSSGNGDGTDSIDCAFTGEPITIGVCARYMIDALNAFPSQETVLLEIGGAEDPILIFEKEPSGCTKSMQLVMPMKLD